MRARFLEDLNSLFHRYEIFLVDAWGVLHDGKSQYPGVEETLEQLKASGKKTVVLSNAARRIPAFKVELAKVGISRALYADAVTSGELTWNALRKQSDGLFSGAAKRYYYQGPQRSRGILNGLALTEVFNLSEAHFMINAGAEGNQPDASAFASMLSEAHELDLPMVCANPDRIAIRGGVRGISAGAIAIAYEQLGGSVVYFGKPYSPIYQHCFDMFPDIAQSDFVMLGDGLATDIRGANKAGIDSIFLSSGIHYSELNGADVIAQNALFERYQAWPDYVLQSLGSRTAAP